MVKKIIRTAVIEGTSLYLASQLADGLYFAKGFQSLAATAIVLMVGSLLVRPIINILLLPINLVTFNFLRWLNHSIVLFLVDLALPEFAINTFAYKGFQSEWFDIPAITLQGGAASYLAFSILISIISGIIYWLVDKK